MSTYNFKTPEGQSFVQQVKNARARRNAAKRRAMKRLDSEPHKHYKRNFTEGKVCEHERGCDRPAYAIDPLRKRDKVFLCRACYMRSHRATRSPEARERFYQEHGY